MRTETHPPGWYPDPRGGSELRWFNGTDWTNPAPPPAERRFTIHYGFVVLAAFSLLGTLIPSIFWFVVAGNAASDPGVDPDAAATASGISSTFGVIWLLWGGMWTLIWAAFAIHHTLQGRRK